MSQGSLVDGTKTGRGSVATEETKQLWREAYEIYRKARGNPADRKLDRTARLAEVAEKLQVSPKVAKRRIRNYEAAHKAGRI